MASLLEVDQLKIDARKDDGILTPIVKGVSFNVKPGEVVALIGESGSGKTTIALSALGYTKPGLEFTSGEVRLHGQDVMVSDFVEAAKVRGEGLWWIITREILPNVVMPLATDFGLRFVWIILFISSLSFLGLGVQPPMSDWGSMVKENLGGLPYGSIAPLMPSLAIATLTIAINLIVDDISAHTGGKLSNRMI